MSTSGHSGSQIAAEAQQVRASTLRSLRDRATVVHPIARVPDRDEPQSAGRRRRWRPPRVPPRALDCAAQSRGARARSGRVHDRQRKSVDLVKKLLWNICHTVIIHDGNPVFSARETIPQGQRPAAYQPGAERPSGAPPQVIIKKGPRSEGPEH